MLNNSRLLQVFGKSGGGINKGMTLASFPLSIGLHRTRSRRGYCRAEKEKRTSRKGHEDVKICIMNESCRKKRE